MTDLRVFNEDCPICTEPASDDMIVFSCGHFCHYDCFLDRNGIRLRPNSKCPICRAAIPLYPRCLESDPMVPLDPIVPPQKKFAKNFFVAPPVAPPQNQKKAPPRDERQEAFERWWHAHRKYVQKYGPVEGKSPGEKRRNRSRSPRGKRFPRVKFVRSEY